ncbi:MAG: hypothetical protein WCF23_19860 [Candidatus Nitrosopolaris sp.]
MQDCNGKRFGGLVATIPLLMLAIIMLGAPSASALVPFRGFPANHHTAFAPAFLGSPTDTSLLPSHGLSVNYHTGSTPYRGNSNSHVTDAVSSVWFKHIGKTVSQVGNKDTYNNNNNNNYKDTYNNNNNYKDTYNNNNKYTYNNNNKYTYNNNHHGLDVQDKSFIKDVKITDVDRSNPHLLKVTLERTHNDNGNIPRYISVVAVGKNDQTVAGSTTLKGDDINNSLTVNVLLKNKNNKNGHLDASGDVTVWVVPATISN